MFFNRLQNNRRAIRCVWVTMRGTMSNKEWQRMKRMIISGKRSDNEYYKERQLMAMNNKEWERVIILTNFPIRIRIEPTIVQTKENSLNIEEDLERGYWINSRKSLVGSEHSDKCSYEIAHENVSGWGIPLVKITSIKRNH